MPEYKACMSITCVLRVYLCINISYFSFLQTEQLYRVLSDGSVQTAVSSLIETIHQLRAAEEGEEDCDLFLAMLAVADDACAYVSEVL